MKGAAGELVSGRGVGVTSDDKGLIVVAANSSWNIVNFRGGLVKGLVAAGYRVIVVAPEEGASADQVRALGAAVEPVAFRSSRLSPVADLALLVGYGRLFRRYRPRAMLGFTIKPNIFGSIAARIAGVRAINNISGLGTAFLRGRLLRRVASGLYRRALAGSSTVFFQNDDDCALFVSQRLVRADQTALLNGSGVDLDRFVPRPERAADGEFRFLLVARLLWDKGVGEFVEAARIVRARHPNARFQLLGFVGADNRSAVPRATLDQWCAEGVVDYLGATDDVRPAIAAADCVVLPSYREGLPRSLIEAAAMGRPAIATDVPGCRAAIEVGVTGLPCAPRSASSLADAMERIMSLEPAERTAMGSAARARAERLFDQRTVVAAYLDAIER